MPPAIYWRHRVCDVPYRFDYTAGRKQRREPKFEDTEVGVYVEFEETKPLPKPPPAEPPKETIRKVVVSVGMVVAWLSP